MVRNTFAQYRMVEVKPKRKRSVQPTCKTASWIFDGPHSRNVQSTQSNLEKHHAFDTAVGIVALQLVAFWTGCHEAAVKDATFALYSKDSLRVVPDGLSEDIGVNSSLQIRGKIYQSFLAPIVLVSVILLNLLLVTVAGIAGLSSFCVSQRRLESGARRELGAVRRNILSNFQIENLVISAVGLVIGAAFVTL